MSDKPFRLAGYDETVTEECERVLVTLLNGLGPLKNSVFLIGGLAPRYLVPARPPDVPRHAGTLDVDLVIDIAVLADTEAYRTLEENLQRIGFTRAESRNKPVSWRWRLKTERGIAIIVELLTDAPGMEGGKIVSFDEERVSAINIPYASMVRDHHVAHRQRHELLNNNGIAEEVIRCADIVCFLVLKALALNQRGEPKDAHDLIYCLEYYPGGIDAVATAITQAKKGRWAEVIASAIDILALKFTADGQTEGHIKEGPVKVAKFEQDAEDESSEEARENRILRQRNVSTLIEVLLEKLTQMEREN